MKLNQVERWNADVRQTFVNVFLDVVLLIAII